MKTVLLTGATGFIGRHTISPLLKKNYNVHAITSNSVEQNDSNVQWHRLDLHDTNSIEKLLKKIRPSHLLHLAWYAKPDEYWTSYLNLKWLNTSLNLLEFFIKECGERVVFVGTCAEYDWQYGHCEEYLTPCVPKSLYGASKHSLNALLTSIANQEKISSAWARIFYLFGPHEYTQRLVPSATNTFLDRQNFLLKNGDQVRDYMYVLDVAEALVELLDGKVTGPVNIASGKAVSIKEIIMLVAKQLNCTDLLKTMNQEHADQKILTADVARLTKEVKWQPKYSLENAISETVSWWGNKLKNA